MANIAKYLQDILSARYGKDVRQSIHDSIDAINTQVTESETSALVSATNAANSASTASTKASSASTSATESATSAVMAESYAKGGTGTRTGEDLDNAKYYSEIAKAVANVDIATTSKAGIVKPDGTSIIVDTDGTVHAQTGTNIEALSDIGDVNIQNPQDKQALVYDSATKKWKNGQGSVSPIDNLTSNSTTEPLSANQGRVLNNQKLEKEVISDEWNASITYAVGQYCIHNNILWKCLVANTNIEPAEGTYWTKVSVANEIASVNSSLSDLTKPSKYNYVPNDVFEEITFYKKGSSVIMQFNRFKRDITPTEGTIVIGTIPEGYRSIYTVSSVILATLNGVPMYVVLNSSGNIGIRVTQNVSSGVNSYASLTYFC